MSYIACYRKIREGSPEIDGASYVAIVTIYHHVSCTPLGATCDPSRAWCPTGSSTSSPPRSPHPPRRGQWGTTSTVPARHSAPPPGLSSSCPRLEAALSRISTSSSKGRLSSSRCATMSTSSRYITTALRGLWVTSPRRARGRSGKRVATIVR